MLALTLFSHEHILSGQTSQFFILLLLFQAQRLNLLTLVVDNLQLVADKTTSKGLFNVVSAMDSLEEMIKEGSEITTVKGVDGIAILAVGLPLLHGMIDVGLVVVSPSELNHFATHKDVLMTNGSNEGYTFKRSAA